MIRELRRAAILLPFAFTDLRLPWDPVISASDAEGEGGLGVVEASLPAAAVGDVGRTSELWRYRYEDSVRARDHALSQQTDSALLG